MTEWDASAYHRESSLQSRLAGKSLAALTLKGDERVLDVGCGDGKVTAAIAARVPRGSVVGVDPSHRMIAFAHDELAERGITFVVGDVRSLPFRDRFDLVVSFNALHWVPEQERALRSIRDALAPGGRTLLQFVPRGERLGLEEVIEDVRKAPRWASFFAGFRQPFLHPTTDEYAALAAAVGLQVDAIEVQPGQWDFGSREGFVRFAQATFVEWTRMLPEERRGEFIADVLDRYTGLADEPADRNVFRFYQMEAALRRA